MQRASCAETLVGSTCLRLYPANRPEEVDCAELSSSDGWFVLRVGLPLSAHVHVPIVLPHSSACVEIASEHS